MRIRFWSGETQNGQSVSFKASSDSLTMFIQLPSVNKQVQSSLTFYTLLPEQG